MTQALWLLAVMGCTPAPSDTVDTWPDSGSETGTGTGSDDTGATDVGTDTNPGVAVTWDSTGVTVTPATPTSYRFGMIEVGAGGWRGEDCRSGEAGFRVCHTFSGVTLRLDSVASPFDVIQGSTTLFDANQAPGITYYLARPQGDCWTWGYDPSYYTAIGCREVAAP